MLCVTVEDLENIWKYYLSTARQLETFIAVSLLTTFHQQQENQETYLEVR